MTLILADHPTVRTLATSPPPAPQSITVAQLRAIALECGADDVGIVSLDAPGLEEEREPIREALPAARTLVSLVLKMNRGPIRTPARSVANLEFHHTGDRVNEVGGAIVRRLEALGVAAINPSMGFPMEMDNFPDRLWVVSHKRVAEAAGMGVMGIHRNVIHPKFGSFVLLGTVVTDVELEAPAARLDYNPCVECKLCVAACPVGAISPAGDLDFSACYTHNYREFMSGFTAWAEEVAEAGSARGLRKRVSASESASMWQSLSFGANYKSAYCLGVCPAGEDVMQPFLDDRAGFMKAHVRPLQAKVEPVYVVPGSDAEAHVAKRFPHKPLRRVSNALRPTSIPGFLSGLHLTFQPGQAADLDAVYHFTFRGDEKALATVTIRDGKLTVERGHQGESTFHLKADSKAWLAFLAKDLPLAIGLLTGRIRFRGSPKWLLAFARCFPS